MWKNKRVLITGSEGLIGRELSLLLETLGAKVFKADLKLGNNLTNPATCLQICQDKDCVFHLAGIKGSPKMTNESPLDFFEPMVMFNTNMIRSARICGVKQFLYTSSIAVEHPETDFFPSWAKLTGEHQIEASRIQYPESTKYVIVRPANIYGRFDNFKNPNAMVITSLIRKALDSRTKTLEVWGDGTQVRDFLNARDCARGMIQAMEQMPEHPVNLCSGEGHTIAEIADIISTRTNKPIKYNKSKPRGADSRVMALNWDFKPIVDIVTGIEEVINWQT